MERALLVGVNLNDGEDYQASLEELIKKWVKEREDFINE